MMGYLILYKIIWIRYEQNYIPFGIELTNQIFKKSYEAESLYSNQVDNLEHLSLPYTNVQSHNFDGRTHGATEQ